MTAILFVCTGNLCRSPIAEGLLREAIAAGRAPSDWRVDSAGIQARHGLAPAPLAIEVAAELGADISAQRSRPLEAGDFVTFDWLVALDAGHFDLLSALAPESGSAGIVMLQDASGETLDVPDPFGRRRRAFLRAARLIAAGIDTLPERLGGARGL